MLGEISSLMQDLNKPRRSLSNLDFGGTAPGIDESALKA